MKREKKAKKRIAPSKSPEAIYNKYIFGRRGKTANISRKTANISRSFEYHYMTLLGLMFSLS